MIGSIGTFLFSSNLFSSHPAEDRAISSLLGGATNCTPTGSPSAVIPAGVAAIGQELRLKT